MITAMSLTNGTLTAIIDGGAEIRTARSDHPKWAEILEAYKANNEDQLAKLLSLKAVVEEFSYGNLTVSSAGVLYRGKPLHTLDAQRIMAFLRDGIPYERYAKFMARKMKNPSARAVNEMYKFLENKYMPLTPQGTFIAYKGVRRNYFSVTGNTKTVVLQGEVDAEGHILNRVGDTIEIERSSCDDDYTNCCSFGLHAGSLEYATGFGDIVILVEIDPADVVSVPEEGKAHKLRCCKYKVVGVYTGPLPSHYTNEFSSTPTPEPAEELEGEECPACHGHDCCCDDERCPDCDEYEFDCTCDEERCHACNKHEDDCTCEYVPPVVSDLDAYSKNVPEQATASDLISLYTSHHYKAGYTNGYYDKNPKYLYADDRGADSEEHRRYILGYLQGYRDQQSSNNKEG